MKKRTIAIATSIAALSFAAAPIASAASASHTPVKTERVERVHDMRSDRAGRSKDTTSLDRSHETQSRDVALDR